MKSWLLVLIALVSACSTTSKENLQFKLGNEYAKDGLYREALTSYKKAQKAEPDNPIILRNIGIVQLKLGLLDKATESLEKSLLYFSSNFETNFYLAESFKAKNDLDNASFRYRRALEINPNDVQAKKGLAWCLLNMNRLDQAKTVLSAPGLAKDPQAAILKARIMTKQGKDKEALDTLKSVQSTTSPQTMPYLASAIGDVELSRNNSKEALRQYSIAIRSVPLMFSGLLGAANASFMLKQYDRAKTYAEQAARVQPDNPEPWKTLAQIAQESGKFKEAQAASNEYRKRKRVMPIANTDRDTSVRKGKM
jgi:tetratricopeptide (TPR) repeat protein